MNARKSILLQIAWLVIATTFILTSCQSGNNNIDHPAYFDKVFECANSIGDKSMAYLDSVYNAFPDAGPGDLCREYHFKAYYYRSRHEYPKATLYADSILYASDHASNKSKYNLQYAEANLLKGDILYDQGLYSTAYHYYYFEKRIADNPSDSCNYNAYSSDVNERLAVINYQQGEFMNAIPFYKKALYGLEHSCKTGLSYLEDLQGKLSNLAFCYERAGIPDSTLYYYNICLDFLAANGGKYPEQKDFIEMASGVIYGNMGDAYMMKEHYDIADSLYRRDIRINSQKGYYNQDALITKVKLARMYLKTGKVKEAGNILICMGSTNHLDDKGSRISFLKTRADYYSAMGQEKAAIEDLQHYIILRDSVMLNKEKLVSTNVNSVFQVLKQENDISSLKKQDDLKTIFLIATILFLLMGVVIIVLTIRNAQGVKRHNEEVKKRNKEQQFALVALELRNRENARLARVLAHDLKNPIHAIASIASILLFEPNRSAEDAEMLELIKDSVTNLSDIIDDVLINRNKSGAVVLNKAPTDLAELLKHSVSLLQFKASEKEQTIKFEGENTATKNIDSDQIWRVINNLLVNSIKFSPHNTTIKVWLKKLDNKVLVSVADEGIGIPPDYGNKIFDLFTKTKRQGTEGEETFGLGLYISRHIIEAHGGKIWFENAPVRGTVFYVELPA